MGLVFKMGGKIFVSWRDMLQITSEKQEGRIDIFR